MTIRNSPQWLVCGILNIAILGKGCVVSAQHLIPIDDRKPATLFWADVIEACSAPGDVVLVPFAEDVDIAGVALERGRRVVLLARTLAQRLRLWGSLVPLDEADRRRALARLAATTKRGTPLDVYINGLYKTACPDCKKLIPADAFIWGPDRQIPVEKEVSCPDCGFQGRAPTDDRDVERADQFERHGLSFWFILEWVVDVQDAPGRKVARRLLEKYSPRNLTSLADVTRKIDAELADDLESQHILRWWLLQALDAGRQQPDSFDSSRVEECNVWQILAQVPEAARVDVPVRPVLDLQAFFDETDPAPNVAIVAGPTRRLAQQLPQGGVALILGAPPRLEAKAWTWEQLWSRWIFGRGAAGGLQPPIGGWARYIRALDVTMAALIPALRAGGRMIFRFRDTDPDRAAALLMALASRTDLGDFVYQPPTVEPANLFDTVGGTYQMTFEPVSSTGSLLSTEVPDLAEAVGDAAVDAAMDVVNVRAEPLPSGWITAAVMVHLARSGFLSQAMTRLGADSSPLAFVKQHVRQGLRAALSEGLLTAVAGSEPTHWWLADPPRTEPLAERVEQAVIDRMAAESPVTPAEIYREFSGWLTPEAELVEALFLAYGEEFAPDVWRYRPVEKTERRAILGALRDLGERLGFSVGPGIADITWGEGGQATHAFRVLKTGRWSELGIQMLPESVAGYVVLPDRLVDLLRVKLTRNPLWRRELVECGWALVKAQHLLGLAGVTEVDRQEFKKIVGLDPIIERAEAQMPLF